MTAHFKPVETPEQRLARRYGKAVHEIGFHSPGWNAALDLLLAHKSVRRFLDKPVEEGTIETLVAAAQSAPTSSNLQTWSVLAVEDPERKARLSVLAGDQAFIREAPLFLIWLIDQNKLRAVGAAKGSEPEALDYLESFLLGAVDTSLAAQNATVALESLGLGATYVGGIRNRPLDVAAELDLPPHTFALFGMAVGWPDPGAGLEVKPRQAQDVVLHRERYSWSDAKTAAIDDYNPRIRAFQRRQSMIEQDWTSQALKRTASAQSMAGRHILREVLNRRGFVLR